MSTVDLYTKISSLPEELKKEVEDFVEFLRLKMTKEEKGKEKKNKGGIKIGLAKGMIKIKDNLDDPLPPEWNEYMK